MRRNPLDPLIPGAKARRFGRLLLLSTIVGLAAGAAALCFHWLLAGVSWGLLDNLAGYRPEGAAGEAELFTPSDTPLRRWLLLLLPAAGGLVSGAIVYLLAPEAEGHGTDSAIEAYHRKGGNIRARVPFVKMIASAITIGSGGSGGREGPIAQMGAGVGSMIGRALRLSQRDRTLLLAAGMGAGIAAMFHAPLAGALFAAEVLYREIDFEFELIVPATVASIVSYSTSCMVFGFQPLFRTPEMLFRNPVELVGYLILAVIMALAGGLFIRVFYGVRDAFRRLSVPLWIAPAIGGLLTGCVGFVFPDALATGYGIVQGTLDGHLAWTFLLIAALARMATTSFSIGSGGSGGVFGPSVVIGAALGGAVGLVLAEYAPFLAPNPESYALVGMAAFFAAAANTPLSSVIIVSEMTGNYYLLVPTMWTCALAFAMSSRTSLYEKQVASRADAPRHSGEMALSVLRRLRIRDHMLGVDQIRDRLLGPGTPYAEIVRRFSETGGNSFPLVDEEGRLAGWVTDAQLRLALAEHEVGPLLVAQDLAVTPITVEVDATVDVAVRRMIRHQLGELAVVSPEDPDRLLGVISRTLIVTAYDREILQAEQPISA
jgi:CIC family chloride channel protein